MIATYKDLLKRVENFKLDQNLDLSSGEDLSIGIMNLISIEEHLFFTYGKTKKSSSSRGKKYLKILNDVRKMRTELLKQIIKDYEGEVWCIGKHLLATSMRVMEVGTKELKKGENKKAEDLFKKSYELYSLFWGLVLSNDNKALKLKKPTDKTVFKKLGDLVQHTLDCCKE